jgi:asparagine synthase (glutamine-hydrolysing)
MCGIAGIYSFNYKNERQLPHIIAMTRAMKHRGPDDEGYILLDGNNRIHNLIGNDSPAIVINKFPDAKVAEPTLHITSSMVLGHRRLSIQDLSAAGHQPMQDSSGRYWIVFNGEIYNFKEIRSQLKRIGHQFITNSDTEVILAAYSQWKENCLLRFNGDFAFALWDRNDGTLFCARDRIGIKPFYYNLTEKAFTFASDIKTLIASGLYKPEPDAQGLYLAMAFGIAPRPITAFKGILALEQAHWMRLHPDGRLEKHRYWQVPFGTQEHKMKEADAVELLEDELKRAVGRRLLADVPIGTFMSGGIDSTTISALAAQQHPGIKAFTLGFQKDAPELDEVSEAQATARMHPMRHIIEYIDSGEVLTDLSKWMLGYEEPFYGLAANYVITKTVKKHGISVVLNGLGGDELFAGYSYYKYHQIPRMPWLGSLYTNIQDLIPSQKVANIMELLSAQTPDRLHTILFRHLEDKLLRQLFSPSFGVQFDTLEIIHNLYAKDLKFVDTIEALSYMDLMNCIGNHHVH